MVECKTVVEEKCEENTSGYTTNTKCSNWPREECTLSKQQKTKFSPLTKCDKVENQRLIQIFCTISRSQWSSVALQVAVSRKVQRNVLKEPRP